MADNTALSAVTSLPRKFGDFLDGLGRQMLFYIRVIRSVPRTIAPMTCRALKTIVMSAPTFRSPLPPHMIPSIPTSDDSHSRPIC